MCFWHNLKPRLIISFEKSLIMVLGARTLKRARRGGVDLQGSKEMAVDVENDGNKAGKKQKASTPVKKRA